MASPISSRTFVLGLALAASGAAHAVADEVPPPAVPAEGKPADDAKVLFPLSAYSAFGSSLAQSGHFSQLGWNEAQFNAFLDGIRAAYGGKPIPMDDTSRQMAAEMGRRIGEIASSAGRRAAGPPDQKAQLEHYFKDMRKRLGLQISDSGLGYNVQAGRNGIRPRPGDTIVFSCAATAADGTTKLPQLSSEGIRVKMDGMLPGLMEGLQMMTVESHAVFVLPPSLSFGAGPWPEGIQPGSPLVYWIALHEVISAGTP
jgi:FKBP-type peptidyl-prolyl cis-trans isomerase FkpA